MREEGKVERKLPNGRPLRGELPRQRGDEVCGGLVPFGTLQSIFRKFNMAKTPLFDKITKLHRLSTHIRGVELHRHPIINDAETHQDLRVRYMLQTLDEPRWLSLLKQREKKREKSLATHMILEMFCGTIEDLFRNLTVVKGKSEIMDIGMEIDRLIVYTNERLDEVAKRFKNKALQITDEYLMSNERKRK